MTDHYSTLGVDRGASADEIKKAYRKMASQHHPDKGGDTQKFQQVEEAYRTLSDDNARAQYDNPQPQGGFHFHTGGFPGGGFEEIFRHFGGGGFDWGQRMQPRNRTINVQTVITLEEAFHGKELVASITLPNGREQVVNVKIPAGIQDGTTLRLAGMGEDTIQGAARGDIHLTVRIENHNVFQRHGDDLVMSLTIPVWDAILGSKQTIKTIDDKELEVTIQPGTQFGQTMAVQNAGMPSMNDTRFRGRLLLKVHITIPGNLTDQQKDKIREAINQ